MYTSDDHALGKSHLNLPKIYEPLSTLSLLTCDNIFFPPSYTNLLQLVVCSGVIAARRDAVSRDHYRAAL